MKHVSLNTTIKNYSKIRTEIIRQLYYNEMLTLTELSALSHKSIPLVTTIVNDLITDGYVVEYGLAPSTGGRRALTYLLNKEKPKYIVAVAMDQLVTKFVIYDLLNDKQDLVKMMPLNLANDENALYKLIKFIEENIALSGIPEGQFLGIGIGMPGFMNAEQGINHSFFKNADGGNVRDHLTAAIGLPVYIDNDSSLIAMAELKFGMAKGYKDVMVVNIGWGIGLGMIINGIQFRGHSGYAGEFSHIPVSQSNKLCSCGKRGCLEVDTSLWALVERAEAEMAGGAESSLKRLFEDQTKLKGDHFLDAAKSGDPLAVSILSDAAFLIGKGLSTLIHIMNPNLIVLSGRGAIAGKIITAPIQQAINEFCIARLADQTEIKVSKLAHDSELLGAAALVIEHCEFEHP